MAVAGAGVLAVSLWLPWYSFRIPAAAVDSAVSLAHQLGILGPLVTQAAQVINHLGPLHVSAWKVYTTLPIVLVVCATIGGALALLSLTERASGVGQLLVLAGVVGIALILFRLVAPPLNGLLLHPTWGLFLALAGSVAMGAGGAIANRDERSFAEADPALVGGPSSWSTIHSVPPPASG